MRTKNYWDRMRQSRMSRRAVLRAAARGGIGVAGLALVGCGDDDDDDAAVAQTNPQGDEEEQAAEELEAPPGLCSSPLPPPRQPQRCL